MISSLLSPPVCPQVTFSHFYFPFVSSLQQLIAGLLYEYMMLSVLNQGKVKQCSVEEKAAALQYGYEGFRIGLIIRFQPFLNH